MFKFFFQNGDFIEDKSSFLGISLDTIFTVFITIAIFILGYYINRRIEINKEKRRIKELEEYFKELIVLLEQPLLKQKNSYLRFSQKLKEQNENHLFLEDVTDFKLDQIKEIDNKDLYTIFIKRKKADTSTKTDLFRKLRGSIDFAANSKKSIYDGFDKLMEFQEKFSSRYKQNIKIISEFFEGLLSHNHRHQISPQQDPFLAKFNQIRNEWINMSNQGIKYMDMFIAKDNYIEKLRMLCQNNIHDPRSVYLMKPTMECIYAYYDIVEMKKVYRRFFLLEARGLQKSIRDIKDSLSKFDKMSTIYSS